MAIFSFNSFAKHKVYSPASRPLGKTKASEQMQNRQAKHKRANAGKFGQAQQARKTAGKKRVNKNQPKPNQNESSKPKAKQAEQKAKESKSSTQNASKIKGFKI